MTSIHATIARHPFDFDRAQVERAMAGSTPELIRTHYVVVEGRRFPPKQVIAAVTGLDRSAFISTQARNILDRLGFIVGRVGTRTAPAATLATNASTADERLASEADLLRPYVGHYVAVDPDWTEVIVSGPDPRAVARALKTIDRTGVIFRVPQDPAQDVGGFAW